MTERTMDDNTELKKVQRLSFVTAVFIAPLLSVTIYWTAKYLCAGHMTFTIKNDTGSHITDVHAITQGLDEHTGKLKPGESRIYKFKLMGDSSAKMDITFDPKRDYRVANFRYFDGYESNCEFLLKEQELNVRTENIVPLQVAKTSKQSLHKEVSVETLPYALR